MSHKINLDFITFWSSLLVLMVNSHTASGIITDSNDLQCTHIQCPTKCPEDSYLKSSLDSDDDDFEDYEDQIFSHDSYVEEMGNFQEPPPEVEIHDNHSPQHILKERQKREVFFQDDIERCCDDQKCICNKCEDVPKCAEGYVAVEIEEGQGIPGNCCSIFRCTKKIECQLGVKQSWWTAKCTKCSCFGETELCMQICPEEEILKNCYSEYLQKPMINGAFWKEGRCTSCSCEQGDRRCLTPVCPQLNCDETITLEDECCPKCIENIVDVRTEINEEEEEISTDAPEINNTVINKIEENSSTIFEDHSVVPVVDETETTSSTLETMMSSSATSSSKITGKISSTFRPLSVETIQENVSSTDSISTSTSLSNSLSNSTLTSALETSSSFPTSTEDSTSTVQLEGDLYRTTDDPRIIMQHEHEHEHEHDLSTISTSTEELLSKRLIEQNFFSTVNTTEEVQISSTPITETSEESITKDIIIEDNSTQETTSSTLTTYIETTTYNVDTILLINSTASSTTPTVDLTTASVLDSSTEVASTFTTSDSSEATVTSSNIISTSAATESTTLSETTTTKTISLSTTSMTTTTNTPFDLLNVTLTPNYTTASSSMSTESPTSTSTSTTSSPYTATSDSTTLFNLEESTSRSTTTAPEAVKPFFQSYGNIIRDEPSPSNQNRMRIIFDEIDYVVMIVLFTGSLLCISLGLIIRHTKNRKKMYSSIPNSETSLSQTSTNTVLTA